MSDQPESPPINFVSKHAFAASDVVGRIRLIDWFAHLGRPPAVDATMTVERAGSWGEAAEACRDPGWRDAQYGSLMQLTIWLERNDGIGFRLWGEHLAKYEREVIAPLADGILLPYRRKHGLDEALMHSVRWDLLGALMENTYLGSGHRCFFYSELLRFYEAGHIPCGWRGEWPAGALLVY